MTTTYEVNHAAFEFTAADGQTRMAFRGHQIPLSDSDAERGLQLGAIKALGGEKPEPEAGEIVLDPLTATVDELAEWIRENKPTVNEVVAAADGDGATAQKLLDAETAATQASPRTGVVKGLTVVVQRASE